MKLWSIFVASALLVSRLDYFPASEPGFKSPLTIADGNHVTYDHTEHQGCFSEALRDTSRYAYNFQGFPLWVELKKTQTSAFQYKFAKPASNNGLLGLSYSGIRLKAALQNS